MTATGSPGVGTLLYVTNTDWYFVSHRLDHAVAAAKAGYDVHIATPDLGHTDAIVAAGLTHHPVSFARAGLHPIDELRSLVQLVGLFLRLRPAVIHLVAARAVLLGGLASYLLPGSAVVYAITGQGYAGAVPAAQERLQSRVLRDVLRRRRSRTIFQTTEDRDEFIGRGLVRKDRCHVISGVGVDVDLWALSPQPAEPTVLFASRLFREKGVNDFVAAVRQVRRQVPDLRAIVAGPLERDLPTGVTQADMDAWLDEGVIEYLGHLPSIFDVLAQTSVLALPTYHREGVPKILLEAAAAGVPIVTSDVPGCALVVSDEETGLIVPPRDPAALATAMERLLTDRALADRLRLAARRHVEANFSLEATTNSVLRVYAEARS